MQIQFDQITVPPGHQAILHGIGWQQFESLLDEAGEHRATRYAYHDGELEMMSPLAAHEDYKAIIRSAVEILLEELGVEFRALGSTTLKSDRAAQAVEPDECFYIQHEAQIRGKERLDLNTDPPPDLALEIDLTSRTHFRHYAALGIPELWRYDGRELEILLLDNDAYRVNAISRLFPQFDLQTRIPEIVRQSQQEGRNVTLKAFRQEVIRRLA
ncbi:MAG: Uma2 family endonuclease [Methylococcaceae bacterium]|nr:Uma2 family endonuclease [Methylococcaceae bacterium]